MWRLEQRAWQSSKDASYIDYVTGCITSHMPNYTRDNPHIHTQHMDVPTMSIYDILSSFVFC